MQVLGGAGRRLNQCVSTPTELGRVREHVCRPVTGEHLVADAFGRIDVAVNKLPGEARPSDWKERIEKARQWIAQNDLELACMFPAIGESARRKLPTMEETHGFRSYFQELCDNPSIDALLMCGPGIFVVSAPDEILKPCSEL